MTVSTTNRKAGPFTGNGVTTVFPFVFRMFSTVDLVVVRAVAGVETALMLGVDYTAVLNADQDASPGGQITMTAPLASGAMMIITSALPATQLVQVTNGGGFFPKVFNAVFDRLTILVQQVTETNSRNLTFALTDDTTGYGPLPPLGARNGKVLQFNATTGKPEAGPSSGDITAAVTSAQGYATAAGNSASSAASATADAIAARDQTLAAFDSFDDRYLGVKTVAPTLDNDGNALVAGALYFDTGAVTPANKGMWVYDGTSWLPAYTNSALYVAKAGDTMSGALTVGGLLTASGGVTAGGAVNFAAIATLASAATTAIGGAASNTVSVTGATTITSFGTVASGITREVVFTGALTLTNSANLILPSGANITTAAGDTLTAVSQGAGVWKVTKYQRANGSSLISAGASLVRSAKTAGYTAVSGDNAGILDLNSATAQTLALTAAATLGNGWFIYVRNINVGTWTVDPNAAETVNGVATVALYPNEIGMLFCDGTAFYLAYTNREGGCQVHAQDQQTSGTVSTPSAAGAWTKVPLTTLVHNTSGAALATSQLTLPPGVWDIKGRIPFYRTGASQSRIQNVTDATTAGLGASISAGTGDTTSADSPVYGRVTIAAAKVFELQYWIASAAGSFGLAVSTGTSEICSELWAERVA